MKAHDLVAIAIDAGVLLNTDGSFRTRDGLTLSADTLRDIVTSSMSAQRREIAHRLSAEIKDENGGSTNKWHNKALLKCISIIVQNK